MVCVVSIVVSPLKLYCTTLDTDLFRVKREEAFSEQEVKDILEYTLGTSTVKKMFIAKSSLGEQVMGQMRAKFEARTMHMYRQMRERYFDGIRGIESSCPGRGSLLVGEIVKQMQSAFRSLLDDWVGVLQERYGRDPQQFRLNMKKQLQSEDLLSSLCL